MASVSVRYARTEDGVDIAFAVAGSGPPLLIARALLRLAVDDDLGPDSDGLWLALAKQHSVVIWDHRGFGLSSTAEPEYTMESSIRDVEAVADALRLDGFDMLSHLSTAHPALGYAARHADRVRALALWNPSPPGSSPRTGTFLGLPEIIDTHFYEYIQLAALRQFGWERGRVAKRWVEYTTRALTAESWKRVMGQLEQLDSTPILQNVSARTLIIADTVSWGGVSLSDEAMHYRRKLVALLPNAELVSIKPGSPQTYIEVVTQFLAAEQQTEDNSSGTAIILFADIADSTALTERLGDAAFRDKARELDEALRRAISSNGGTAIDGKLLGDGVLATFGAAREAIACAQEIHQIARTQSSPPRVGEGLGEGSALLLHVGIHAGDVIREANNVYGGAVNIASRVANEAAAGETLVSATVRDLARTSAGVSFDDRGERELKGVGEPVRLFAVRSERRISPSL